MILAKASEVNTPENTNQEPIIVFLDPEADKAFKTQISVNKATKTNRD